MRTKEQISKALDEFYYDQDPYGYVDTVTTREQGLIVAKDLISTPQGTRKAQYDVAEAAAEDPFNEKANELLKDLIDLAEEQEEARKTIKVVLVKVNESPIVIEVEDDLKALQVLVGGYIETILLADKMLIVCNEEGKIMNLPGNRRVGNDIIAGDFFVTACGDEGELVSLSEAQSKSALSMFSKPENYTGMNTEDEIIIKISYL